MRAVLERWLPRAVDSGPTANAAGESHIGAFRAANEDRILLMPERGMFAVADGMGGHPGGDIAAETVIANLHAIKPAGAAITDVEVRHALEACARTLKLRRGPHSGATVAILLLSSTGFTCLWAGDCRCYRLRGGALKQLTRDHRVVQNLVDSGVISLCDARRHPQASVVTRAIGLGGEGLDLVSGESSRGDRYLLCSDGLSDTLSDTVIAQLLSDGSPSDAVAALRSAAIDTSRDNVSIIVAES